MADRPLKAAKPPRPSRGRRKSKQAKRFLVVCTRCPHEIQLTRRSIRIQSAKPPGIRCVMCGGNMVEHKYAA